MQLDENKNYLELKKKKREFLQLDMIGETAKRDRPKRFIFSFNDLTLDISRQRIPTNTLNEFLSIGKSEYIKDSVKKLVDGTFYNNSEKVNVTHFVERNPENFSQIRTDRYLDFEKQLKSKSIKRLANLPGPPRSSPNQVLIDFLLVSCRLIKKIEAELPRSILIDSSLNY